MEEKKKYKADEGTIFIGQKPTMVYVDAISTRLVRKNMDEIKVVGIGVANIGVAVEAVEKAIRYLAVEKIAVEKGSITIGPKEFEDGGSVTQIEIVLKKIK
jgi:DNA-binding protein Alba